ncbi:YtpI family protein [Baia soyae]|uniref:YtpI-like protein n=1 Tax=Baia soyae TaxID=1544746 RepID=A0A4R2RZN3_9BACL|nr:YtpI family protein [Baia soyae]TCP69068.1 YtpI-like protein [Baia soyae]
MNVLIFTLGMISFCAVVVFSFAYRRSQGNTRMKNQGFMNISMGTLFLSLAGLEYATLTFKSPLGYILLALIALIGLVCFYYGYKRVQLSRQKS